MIKIGKIEHVITHMVGNKAKGEGVKFSKAPLDISLIKDMFEKMISKSFNGNDLYEFYNEGKVELNHVYSFAHDLFDDTDRFVEISKYIAKSLYERSVYSKIPGGELSVMYMTGCKIDDKEVDAIAIWKSERKQEVVRLVPTENGYEIEKINVIDMKGIEKGCLIYRVDAETGYKVLIAENSKKEEERRYWVNEFLKVRPCANAYQQTMTLLSICKDFIGTELKDKSNSEKAVSVAKIENVISNKNEISLKQFAKDVFGDADVVDDFLAYAEENDHQVQITNDDPISLDSSLGHKKSNYPKTTIKLDSNFEINVYGGLEYLLNGHDDLSDLNYYTLYYSKEK